MFLGDINLTPQQEGSTAGSIVGSFIPIPGASEILSIIGNILGGLLGGKPSNTSAYIWFTAGPAPQPWMNPPASPGGACVQNVCGDEKTAQTTGYGGQISNGLAQILNAFIQRGVTFRSPGFVVVVGVRDGASIRYADHSGRNYETNIAGVGDAAGTVKGVLNWLAGYSTPNIAPYLSGQALPATTAPAPVTPGSPTAGGQSAPAVPASSAASPTLAGMPPLLLGAFGLIVLGLMVSK